MPRGTVQQKRVFAVLAGLIAVLLGAGLASASADVHGALVEAVGLSDDTAAGQGEDEVDEVDAEAPVVVGQLEADHAADEVQAKLEDEPEEVDEEADEPSDGDDGANAVAAVSDPPDVPDPDTDDTDGGKTSIPLPGGSDDTEADDDTDDAAAAAAADEDSADTEEQDD